MASKPCIKGKIRYKSPDAAQHARSVSPFKCQVYFCTFCEGWHLTGKGEDHSTINAMKGKLALKRR